MNPRAIILLLVTPVLATALQAVTTLQDTRNFFPEHETVPVGADVGMPNYYYGSDLYSVPVEGPIWPRYSIELEAGILFFLGRDSADIDGKNLHHGFNVDIGFPLSRKIRPNHYINLELFAGYDKTNINAADYVDPAGLGHSIKVDSYSLILNYKWYTPPLLRERFFPHVQVGIGNTFMKLDDTITLGTGTPFPGGNGVYKEWDTSIFTLKGTIGTRVRLTEHVGAHVGYHLIYMGDNHKGFNDFAKSSGSGLRFDSSGDINHALDLGLSLIF